MGMMYLAAAAAAKKKREQEHATARRRRARQREEENRREFSQSSSSEKKYTYIDYLYREIYIAKNPKLVSFFDKLTQYTKECINEECAPLIEDCNEDFEKIEEISKELEKMETEMKEIGIHDEMKMYNDTIYYLSSSGKADIYNPFTYKTYKTTGAYLSRFNGIYIDREMLENPDNNKYRLEYNREKTKLESITSNKQQLKKDLKKEKRSIKFSYEKRMKKEERIRSLEQSIRWLELNEQWFSEDMENAKRQMEIFESLTPEQKDLILRYLVKVEEMQKIKEKWKKNYWKIENISNLSNKEIWNQARQRALERIIKESNIENDEDGEYSELDEIYKELDKVGIKGMTKAYDMNTGYIDEYMQKKYLEGIEWFIKEVYEADDSYTDRNASLLKKNGEKTIE